MKPDPFAAPPPPSPELLAAVAAMKPVRTRRPGLSLAVVGAVALAHATAMQLFIFGGSFRRDLPYLPLWWVLGFGALWAAAFAIPLGLAMLPPRGHVLPVTPRAALAAGCAAASLVILSLVLAPTAPGKSLVAADGHQLRVSLLHCLLAALAVTSVPLVTGLIVMRRTLPVGSRAVGAAIGAASGALGGLLLHFHCPWTDPLHVALGHGGAIVVGAIAGALIAPRILDL